MFKETGEIAFFSPDLYRIQESAILSSPSFTHETATFFEAIE
jgi:hypothetical protein